MLLSFTSHINAQNVCDNFIGKWDCRGFGGHTFIISKNGNIFKMSYKGPNYSTNEASPCNNGQLENEGMKLTYSEKEDAVYWDGKKFTRIGQRPISNNTQKPTNNQTAPNNNSDRQTTESCNDFIGIWKTNNQKFIISKDGPIYKLGYTGPTYSSDNASVCVNGQLEYENMKLTYSPNDNAFFWDGKKFIRESNTIIKSNQISNGSTVIIPTEINFDSFKGYLNNDNENYFVRLKQVNLEGQLKTNSQIHNKILEILAKIKRISQPQCAVNDTLNLNTSFAFSYRNFSSSAMASFFADYTIEYTLVSSKSRNIVFQNIYKGTNYKLLTNGFASEADAAKDIINTQINQTLNQFFLGNYPIVADITDVTELNRKKDEAKFVKINVGASQGIFPGFEFIILGINKNDKKGDISVTEVFEDYSICKVLTSAKDILRTVSTEQQKLKVKTKYKAAFD